MTQMKFPIGVQFFEGLIGDGYTYVDKTRYIKDLVTDGKIYFLGRPRRFGKSLLLSTLEAFFEGRRELFKGLDIDKWDEWDWAEYPVIHIDLNAKDYTYKESVWERLNEHLIKYEGKYGVFHSDTSLDSRFRAVIEKAYEVTGRKVVVLIDEYDKPILDNLHDDAMLDMHRDSLRAFYSVLKSSDRYLQFCFLTGVTKFGQLNVFSGLNNLNDISLSEHYSGICGITEEELHRYFDSAVRECAVKWECTADEAYAELKRFYDGYHFSPALLDVYNPWSVLKSLYEKTLGHFWNATGGTMSMLYKLMKAGKVNLSELEEYECSRRSLDGSQVTVTSAAPILYQTGYLTIKSYNHKEGYFILKFPNYEVKSGFLDGYMPESTGVPEDKSDFEVRRFVSDVRKGDPDRFLERMQAFFADFPYENALKTEKDFQNILYCVMAMMGLRVKVEQHSSRGSADMVIETGDYIYILEFKVDKSADEALAQIADRGYAARYALDSRRLFRIGVSFSLSARNIADWKIQ